MTAAPAGPAPAAPSPDRRALPPRWSWHSLRGRMMLAILIWAALGIGGIWFSATRLFAKHVEEQYHEELEVHLRELAGLVRIAPDGRMTLIRPLSDPRYNVPLSGFYWQVTIDGGPGLRSASLSRGRLNEDVAHSSEILHFVETGPTGPTITYGFARIGPGGRHVHYLIATDQRLLNDVISSFTRELLGWLAALAAALAMTGFAIVIFAFRPLDQLALAISRLRAGGREGITGHYPSEVSPLVDDLNAYIVHNSKIVEHGRIEASNLAHALRTPLAVIIDEAERLAQDKATAPAAEVLLNQSQLMLQQMEYRLARARSASGSGLPGSVSRIAEVLPPILSAMQRLHPDIRFTLTDEGSDTASLPVDPVDLAELLSNLLDNAGKWAAGTVAVTVTGGAPASIAISDDGPGLNPDQIEAAFQVGVRFDPHKPGSGLGLAIARDIAESYGLALHLGPRADGRSGLTAWLGMAKDGAAARS